MAISAFWAPVYRALVEKVLCAEANLQNNGALVYMVRALRWLLFCAMHYILSSMGFI